MGGEGIANGALVLTGVGFYMLVMLAIGLWSSRRIRSATDYIVAGRRLGLPLVTGTLFATWFCAGTMIGAPAQAYLFGNQGTIFDPWSAALCLVLAGMFFNRLMRRGGYITVADFFETRYGRKMGLLAAVILVIAQMGWVGSMLVAFGVMLQYFSGLPLAWGIVISCLVVVAYTYLGGMWSVTITDLFQALLLTVGLLIMLPRALSCAGGWDYFIAHAGNQTGLPAFALGPVGESGFLGYRALPGWIYYIGAWMSIGFGSLCSQDLMQRTLSAKDEKTAVYASYLAGALYLTVGLIPVLIGMIAFNLYPGLSLAETEMIMPLLAVQFLPPLLMVFFVAGVVAAIMSSCDSALLAASSILGYNMLRYIKPGASDRFVLKITRICVPLVALVSLLMALYLETVYNLMVLAWSLMLVGLIAPYVAGCFWKKTNEPGAIAAVLAGVISWAVFIYLYLPFTSTVRSGIMAGQAIWDAVYMGTVPAFIVSIIALIAVALATQKSSRPRPLTDINGNPVQFMQWAGWGLPRM